MTVGVRGFAVLANFPPMRGLLCHNTLPQPHRQRIWPCHGLGDQTFHGLILASDRLFTQAWAEYMRWTETRPQAAPPPDFQGLQMTCSLYGTPTGRHLSLRPYFRNVFPHRPERFTRDIGTRFGKGRAEPGEAAEQVGGDEHLAVGV